MMRLVISFCMVIGLIQCQSNSIYDGHWVLIKTNSIDRVLYHEFTISGDSLMYFDDDFYVYNRIIKIIDKEVEFNRIISKFSIKGDIMMVTTGVVTNSYSKLTTKCISFDMPYYERRFKFYADYLNHKSIKYKELVDEMQYIIGNNPDTISFDEHIRLELPLSED